MLNRIMSIACFLSVLVCGGCIGVCLFNIESFEHYSTIMLVLIIGNALMSCGFVYFGLRCHEDAVKERKRKLAKAKYGF